MVYTAIIIIFMCIEVINTYYLLYYLYHQTIYIEFYIEKRANTLYIYDNIVICNSLYTILIQLC